MSSAEICAQREGRQVHFPITCQWVIMGEVMLSTTGSVFGVICLLLAADHGRVGHHNASSAHVRPRLRVRGRLQRHLSRPPLQWHISVHAAYSCAGEDVPGGSNNCASDRRDASGWGRGDVSDRIYMLVRQPDRYVVSMHHRRLPPRNIAVAWSIVLFRYLPGVICHCYQEG